MRIKAALVAGAAGLLGTALVAAPAPAAPVGPFGAPLAIGITKAIGSAPDPQLAALADGTALAAWLDASGAISLRVRPAGSSAWGAAQPLPLEAGWSLGAPSYTSVKTFVAVPAGPSAFLLVWQEYQGLAQRIRAQRLSRTGAPAESAQTLAGPGGVYLSDVATNASGRAAVLMVTGASPIPVEVRVRPTPTAAWGAATLVGQIPNSGAPPPSALTSVVAVHSSGTVCALYPTDFAGVGGTIAITMKSRCGAPASLATAPEQSVGVISFFSVLELMGPTVAMTATASGFMVTGVVASSGVVPWPAVSSPPATRILVRTRPSGSGSWSTAATLGRSAELNGGVTALSSATGVAVHYMRLRGGVGSSPATGFASIDQRVAWRQGSGAWTPPATVASLAGVESIFVPNGVFASLTATLGPAGEMLVSAPGPQSPSGWSTGFVRRSGWAGGFATATGLGTAIGVGAVIVASGRATALGRDTAVNVRVAQTALPTPFVRSSAKIPSAPKAGAASSCSFAFTDAASVTRQWRVNGTVRSTASTYTPSSSDRGKTLTCRVTGTNPTGSTVTTSPGRRVL